MWGRDKGEKKKKKKKKGRPISLKGKKKKRKRKERKREKIYSFSWLVEGRNGGRLKKTGVTIPILGKKGKGGGRGEKFPVV